jgi:ATP:ADP antiporter, AAA family
VADPGVKSRRQAAAAGVCAVVSGGIIAQQVAGKAVRDALFLSTFHVTALPWVMAASAALSLLAVLWTSRLIARHAPRRVLLALFALSAASFAADWSAAAVAPRAVAIAVYVQVAVLSPVILSAFWSLVNEHFDPHTARRAVARIAIGGTLGGVVGGLAAFRASTLVSLSESILLLAAVNLVCFASALAIAPRPNAEPTAEQDAPVESSRALGSLLKAPYLRNLAILVAIGSGMSSMLDYVLSTQVTAAYGTGEALLAYFALFGLAVSAVSFLLSVTLGRVAMEKVGVAVNIAVLPAIVILGGAIGLAVPGLASATLLRGTEMVQRNTLFRSAYELLYTPLPDRHKRVAKVVIDVGFDRLGTVLGSGLILAATTLFGQGDQNALLGGVVLLAALTLPLARRLHGGYVNALKRRLREGAEEFSQSRDLLRPQEVDERAGDALIERVERVRRHDDSEDVLTRADRSRLLSAADDLLSKDGDRARRALAAFDERGLPLSPLVALLLADEQLQAEARRALRGVASAITGQLLDALLDPRVAFVVRRRIPAVLSVCKSQRAADGLLLGMADSRFEVRYACVRALVRVVAHGENIRFREETIVSSIEREIQRATSAFSELDDGADEDANSALDLIAKDRVTRSVETIFSLLSLIVDRDGLRLCFRALHQDDEHQRGTALEYLQTVLPPELRDQLLPLLSEAGPIPSARSPTELLTELGRLGPNPSG